MEIVASPVCIRSGRIKVRGSSGHAITLREFQERLLDFFSRVKPSVAFLSAPTGSGKTFTALMPLLADLLDGKEDYVGVLAVYPTRALVYDQALSISQTLKRLGARLVGKPIMSRSNQRLPLLEVLELRLEEPVHVDVRIGLLVLTSEALDQVVEKVHTQLVEDAKPPPRRLVLKSLVEELWAEETQIDYIISFAVPEYPYLVASRLYSNPYAPKLLFNALIGVVEEYALKTVSLRDYPEKLEEIRSDVRRLLGKARPVCRELLNILTGLGNVVFMDEYHVWSGFEKQSMLALSLSYLVLQPYIGAHFRLVFSSATPDREMIGLLRAVLEEDVEEIVAEPIPCNAQNAHVIRGKTVLELYQVETGVAGPSSWLQADASLPDVVEAKLEELSQAQRFMVLGRRASSVEIAAEKFYEKTRIEPIVVTGVRHPRFSGKEALPERKEKGLLPLFGNYAVEIGIDLKNIRYGIIVAATPGELIQRAGRIGRGNMDSKIVIIVPKWYYSDIVKQLNSCMEYTRALHVIAEYMYKHLPVQKPLEKLVRGPLGVIKVYAPLSTLILPLLSSDKAYDKSTLEVFERYLKVLKAIKADEQFKKWLINRTAKNSEVLRGLTSFRATWFIEYERGAEGEETVVDAASISTLLSNYTISLSESGKLRIGHAQRKKISEVFQVYAKIAGKLKYFYDSIVPANVVAQIACIDEKGQDRDEEKTLAHLLRRRDPVYIARPDEEFELLVAYGYGIRVLAREELGSKKAIAYIVFV